MNETTSKRKRIQAKVLPFVKKAVKGLIIFSGLKVLKKVAGILIKVKHKK